jgi:hypothetical protein
VVVPAVRKGRELVGQTLTGFEIVAMLEGSGFGDDIAAFDAAQGDVEAMREAISDRFLDALTAVGDQRAVRAGLDRYVEAGVTLPCIGPISRTDFEATLRAAAPS